MDDQKFKEFYRKGYSATRLLEALGVKEKNPMHWMQYHRKRLGLLKRYPGFKGITKCDSVEYQNRIKHSLQNQLLLLNSKIANTEKLLQRQQKKKEILEAKLRN